MFTDIFTINIIKYLLVIKQYLLAKPIFNSSFILLILRKQNWLKQNKLRGVLFLLGFDVTLKITFTLILFACWRRGWRNYLWWVFAFMLLNSLWNNVGKREIILDQFISFSLLLFLLIIAAAIFFCVGISFCN